MTDFYLPDMDSRSFTIVKWYCCVPDCTHFTRLRDYGHAIHPMFYWHRKRSEWVGREPNDFLLQQTLAYEKQH